MIFKKRQKTMSDRPNVSAEAETAAKATDHALPADGQDEQMKDALTAASEAAAEHVMADGNNEAREDVAELVAQLAAAKADAADLKDKWLRANAEFDNYRQGKDGHAPVRWGEHHKEHPAGPGRYGACDHQQCPGGRYRGDPRRVPPGA
jgi:hypothetical protein